MIDELIRSDRRSILLRLDSRGRVVVSAPKRTPLPVIESFVQSKRRWIAARRKELALRPKREYVSGERFPLAGGWFTLRQEENCLRVRFTGQELILPPGAPEETLERLIRFYKEIAREVFTERIALYAPIVGVRSGPIRVSDAASRWGSCGKDNSVNLNWRLLLGPLEALDYVVVHELCHILRRDHSPAFWKQVERVKPDWKQTRKWLKDHREELQLCTA